MSQLALACEAKISARHLSFLETGRSQPSREMILLLAEQLQVPMRERNVLLISGGYAPIFSERPLSDPNFGQAREAIAILLEGHKPFPAYAVDRHWNVVASNAGLPLLYEGVAEHLFAPPVNALRLSLHPNGLAPKVENLPDWRAHLLHRLQRQVDHTADPVLIELQRELLSYPAPATLSATQANDVFVVLRVRTSVGTLSFFSTTMVFGTPLDVTLSELAVESLFPADSETAETVRRTSSQHLPQT